MLEIIKVIPQNIAATMFGMTVYHTLVNTEHYYISKIFFEAWLVKMVSHCFAMHVLIYEQGGPTFHYWSFYLYFAWVQKKNLIFIIIKLIRANIYWTTLGPDWITQFFLLQKLFRGWAYANLDSGLVLWCRY